MLILTFSFLGIFFFSLIFASNKVSGLPDASDIPISFIIKSIDEIKSFDFSLSWDDKQQNKNRISNLINNALEFISIRDKIIGVSHGLRYYQLFIGGLKNKSAKREIFYRINGLSIELEKILIDLNYMHSDEDKNKIIKNLVDFSAVLMNRNLKDVEPVKYNQIGIVEKLIKKIEPYKILIVILSIIYVALEKMKIMQ